MVSHKSAIKSSRLWLQLVYLVYLIDKRFYINHCSWSQIRGSRNLDLVEGTLGCEPKTRHFIQHFNGRSRRIFVGFLRSKILRKKLVKICFTTTSFIRRCLWRLCRRRRRRRHRDFWPKSQPLISYFQEQATSSQTPLFLHYLTNITL